MAAILLIEPDRVLAQTYQQELEAAGHVMTVCATAQNGIFLADQAQPDLVILELQLVGHSGIEFLYEFRSYADWQTVPVFIQTQVPPGEFIDSSALLKQELGVVAYLYKPHTRLRDLLRTVEEQLVAV